MDHYCYVRNKSFPLMDVSSSVQNLFDAPFVYYCANCQDERPPTVIGRSC
jgi:hypothetical protein